MPDPVTLYVGCFLVKAVTQGDYCGALLIVMYNVLRKR